MPHFPLACSPGFISFVIFMLLQTSTIAHDEFLLSFEFAHILIFFVALILILQAALFSWAIFGIRKRIHHANALDTKSLVSAYHAGPQHWRGGTSRLLMPIAASNHKFLFDYHIIRSLFIKHYNLPADFSFCSYLESTIDQALFDCVNVEISSWVTILLFLLLNVIRCLALGSYTDNPASTCRVFVWGGCWVLLAAVTMYLQSELGMERLLALCMKTKGGSMDYLEALHKVRTQFTPHNTPLAPDAALVSHKSPLPRHRRPPLRRRPPPRPLPRGAAKNAATALTTSPLLPQIRCERIAYEAELLDHTPDKTTLRHADGARRVSSDYYSLMSRMKSKSTVTHAGGHNPLHDKSLRAIAQKMININKTISKMIAETELGKGTGLPAKTLRHITNAYRETKGGQKASAEFMARRKTKDAHFLMTKVHPLSYTPPFLYALIPTLCISFMHSTAVQHVAWRPEGH
jgi:hypothetical protein